MSVFHFSAVDIPLIQDWIPFAISFLQWRSLILQPREGWFN